MRLDNIYPHLKYRVLESLAAAYNTLVTIRDGAPPQLDKFGPISEIEAFAKKRSDISDHLITLFAEAAAVQPSLIVELGVRSGESTVALSRVGNYFGSRLISVDLTDCSRVVASNRQIFVKSDDVKFAKEFSEWCRLRDVVPSIDVLFIDTSHEFDHTVAEIQNWFPLLSPHCKVLFHDTNMSTIYFRKNGTMGVGWSNGRGVVAALEQHFGCQFDERHDFVQFTGGWIIRHFANCNGLTVLERVCPIEVDQNDTENYLILSEAATK